MGHPQRDHRRRREVSLGQHLLSGLQQLLLGLLLITESLQSGLAWASLSRITSSSRVADLANNSSLMVSAKVSREAQRA
jgi:hypothetical protein